MITVCIHISFFPKSNHHLTHSCRYGLQYYQPKAHTETVFSASQHVLSPCWHPLWRSGTPLLLSIVFSSPQPIIDKLLAQLSAAAYIRKSLIAAFLGNVIGALFVVLPSIYFYLWDFDYVQDVVSVRGVEEGEGLNELTSIRGNGVERNGSGNGSLNMKAA